MTSATFTRKLIFIKWVLGFIQKIRIQVIPFTRFACVRERSYFKAKLKRENIPLKVEKLSSLELAKNKGKRFSVSKDQKISQKLEIGKRISKIGTDTKKSN